LHSGSAGWSGGVIIGMGNALPILPAPALAVRPVVLRLSEMYHVKVCPQRVIYTIRTGISSKIAGPEGQFWVPFASFAYFAVQEA